MAKVKLKHNLDTKSRDFNLISEMAHAQMRVSPMTQPPKVLYSGTLDEWGSCYARLQGLRKLEPDITEHDIREYFDKPSLVDRFDWKLTFAGQAISKANSDLLKLCADKKPDILWMDKGWWVWESSLCALRAKGVLLIHHNNDALFPHSLKMWTHYRLIRKTLPLYDLNFTTNLNDWIYLNKRSDLRAELTHIGYNNRLFGPGANDGEAQKELASDILFVGHHEARTERGIVALLDAGLSVTVHGPGWRKARNWRRMKQSIKSNGHYLDRYIQALKSAKIGLSFFSELNYCHTAMRSFETTACGTFLLAMRSGQHLECFKEGNEAEFFGNEAELVQKAKAYLTDESKRREIARRGQQRTLRSDYSWERYMRDDWAKVRELVFNSSHATS